MVKPKPPPLAADNPFLPPESSSKIDAGWGSPDDLEPASTGNPAPIPTPVAAPPPAFEPPPPAPAPAPTVAEPAKPPSGVSESIPPQFKKRSRGKVFAFVLLLLVVLAGGGFAYQSEMNARSARNQAASAPAPTTTPEPVRTSEPLPPPTFSAEAPPSASVAPPKPAGAGAGVVAPAAPVDPEQRAYLDGTALPPGRKIVLDGRVVGISPRKLTIKCGMHRVQIGDQDPENINFPCGGGEVTFTE